MSFGLKGVPATFQRLINEVLREIIGSIAFVYIDNIVCYGKNLDRIQNLETVFQRLREHKLLVNPEKYSLLRDSVTYLGHVISREGVSPDPSKIEAVTKFPIPKNVKDLKSFLGLAGCYRKFIKNFATIVRPLNYLIKDNIEFKWGQEQNKAFKTLKTILTSKPRLQYPNFCLLYTSRCV